MKKILLLLFSLTLSGSLALAQDSVLDNTTYDFWLGKWDANWKNADGSTGSGSNHVYKVLEGTVIEENFKITEGAQAGFLGMSISVYDPNRKIWHQGWADNEGGYFDFIGEVIGEKKIFKTKMVERDGNKIIQRMVFYDIKEDSFSWDWQATRDGGENWDLQWRIKYTKQK
jgi:hypothetical protein